MITIAIVSIILSIIALGFCGFIYYTKIKYQRSTTKTLEQIQRLSIELADGLPPRLTSVEQLADKAIAGVLGLVKVVTSNNRNYLKIGLDTKYWNTAYTDRFTSIINILTNNLISVTNLKMLPNSITIMIPFGKLFIDTDNGEYKQEGEFSQFDLTFLKGNINIT